MRRLACACCWLMNGSAAHGSVLSHSRARGECVWVPPVERILIRESGTDTAKTDAQQLGVHNTVDADGKRGHLAQVGLDEKVAAQVARFRWLAGQLDHLDLGGGGGKLHCHV